jgi:nitrogen regulatory protein P-II 1
MKLEIVAHDDEAMPIIDTIVNIAQTGEIGDGKIFVSNIEDTVRIRTGEKGESAL